MAGFCFLRADNEVEYPFGYWEERQAEKDLPTQLRLYFLTPDSLCE